MLDAYLQWRTALNLVVRFGDESCAKTLATRPEPVRWLVAMSVIESQVFNGGFRAIYYNFCFDFLPDALAGYRGIGAHRQAEALQRVMDSVPAERWNGPNAAWPYEYPMPDLTDEQLDSLEREWYALNEGSTDELKAQFVVSRPDIFNVA